MTQQHLTDAPPPEGSAPPSRFTWRLAMAIIRPAAAGTAAWSLYAVARHYGVPWQLALFASIVYDGIAMGCLYQATEAVRAGRSAAAPIVATLGMASVSVYLNLVHARLIAGGRPAEVLFATPIVGLLVLSALAWAGDLATARAMRGETPMRLPAFGLLGWALAREQATDALKARAVAHVTGTEAAPAAEPARRPRTAHAAVAAHLAELDPIEAIRITADTHPQLNPGDLAQLLASYGVTVDALHVALVLGRAAAPSVRLDRMPAPDPTPLPNGQPAALTKTVMRGEATPDMPQVSGLPLSEAIPAIHRRLTDDASPRAVVQHLALQGRATDTAYVRTALSRARARAVQEAAEEDARRAKAAIPAQDEPEPGTGGYL
jgi:hypothetical protein